MAVCVLRLKELLNSCKVINQHLKVSLSPWPRREGSHAKEKMIMNKAFKSLKKLWCYVSGETKDYCLKRQL